DKPVFLVGVIKGIFDEQNWWYSVCLCGERIAPSQSSPFCNVCATHISDGISRYEIQVFVSHMGGCNVLILHNEDVVYVLKKCRKDLLINDFCFFLSDQFRPNAYQFVDDLIGKKLVFMIDSEPVHIQPQTLGYNVYQICADDTLIQLFEVAEKDMMVDQMACGSTSGISLC
ncbi:hypothetical protein PIB30_093071, partial [Stylosanthes scabra]|nr:hypothetical protein [Stylosanthes scabra]